MASTFADRYKKGGFLDALLNIDGEQQQPVNTNDPAALLSALNSPTADDKKMAFWKGLSQMGASLNAGQGLGNAIGEFGGSVGQNMDLAKQGRFDQLQNQLALKKLLQKTVPTRRETTLNRNNKYFKGYEDVDPDTGQAVLREDTLVPIRDPNAPADMTEYQKALLAMKQSGGSGQGGEDWVVQQTAQGLMRVNKYTGEVAPVMLNGKPVVSTTSDLGFIGDKAGYAKAGGAAGERAQALPQINTLISNLEGKLGQYIPTEKGYDKEAASRLTSATGWGQSPLNPARYFPSETTAGQGDIEQLKSMTKTLGALDFASAFKPMSNADVEAIGGILSTLNNPNVPDDLYLKEIKRLKEYLPKLRESFNASGNIKYGGSGGNDDDLINKYLD